MVKAERPRADDHLKNTRYVLQHGYVDPTKAIEELGLPQTPIETAIADSVKWFRENGYA